SSRNTEVQSRPYDKDRSDPSGPGSGEPQTAHDQSQDGDAQPIATNCANRGRHRHQELKGEKIVIERKALRIAGNNGGVEAQRGQNYEKYLNAGNRRARAGEGQKDQLKSIAFSPAHDER